MILSKLLIFAISTIRSLANIGHGLVSMEDIDPDDIVYGSPIKLDDDLIVTVVKRPDKCIRVASVSDLVTVHYEGRLEDQHGKIFDYSRGEGGVGPFRYQLGAGSVIKGYERGTPGMCKGETRVLVVPPALGYGEQGYPPRIPPNATLHFTVECLSVSDGELMFQVRDKEVRAEKLKKLNKTC